MHKVPHPEEGSKFPDLSGVIWRPLLLPSQGSVEGPHSQGKLIFSRDREGQSFLSFLFKPSVLLHWLSQAGFRLVAEWMVFNPCLTHASKGEPISQGTSDTSTVAQHNIAWLQTGGVSIRHYIIAS